MKLITRITAVIIVVCTAISLTACADTTWAYDYSGSKISSGLYIANTMVAYAQAQNHKDIKTDQKDLFKQTLDGKNAKQWIIDEAKKNCDRYMAIEKKFDELSLTLTDQDKNIIDQSTKSGWSTLGAIYEQNSVSEDTYRLMMTNQVKQQRIFEKYYSKGGLEEVPNDNLLVHFKENFASINMFNIMLNVAEEGKELTEEEKAENEKVRENAEAAVKAINVDKKTFNEAKDIYNHLANEDEHDAEDTEDVIEDDAETKTYIKKDSKEVSEKVVKAIFDDAKAEGEAILIPDDGIYYVCQRYDVTKDPKNFDDMREQILVDVKGEDFNAMVDEWIKQISTTSKPNEASINRYKPQNINFEVK